MSAVCTKSINSIHSFSLLLDLPLAVLTSITSHYLSFPADLCRLDSAVSHPADRRHLHASIDTVFEACVWERETFQRWLLSREHIRCREVMLVNPSSLHTLSPWLAKKAPSIRRLSLLLDESLMEDSSQTETTSTTSTIPSARDLCRDCSQLVSLTLEEVEVFASSRSLYFFPSSLKELVLNIDGCLHDELLKQIATSCPKLELLSLSSRKNGGDSILSTEGTDHLSNLSELRHFKLVHYNDCFKQFEDSFLFSLSKGCKQLKTLELQNCTGYTGKGFIAIGRSCPIESLQLTGSPPMDSLDEALTYFSKLRKLEVRKWSKPIDLSWLENMPFLKEVTLSECLQLKGFQRILLLSKLEVLSLDFLHLQDSDLSCSKPLLSLQSLRISRCDDISNDGITSLLRNSPNLLCLRLKSNVQVEGDILEKALLLCLRLHTFSGRYIRRVRGTLRSNTSAALRTLKLVGCGFWNDEELKELLFTCSRRQGLKSLKLKDCLIDRSSYSDVFSAIESHSSTLRSLTFLHDDPFFPNEVLRLLTSLRYLSSFSASVRPVSQSPDSQGIGFEDYRQANPSARLEIFCESESDDE